MGSRKIKLLQGCDWSTHALKIMPYKQEVRFFEPTDNTYYLVGEDGLVWVQPAIGEPFIIAADNEQQRNDAADFIWGLLHLGLVPYGLALNHRQQVATFGGARLRGCKWVLHSEAPQPKGDEGDDLPKKPAIIVVQSAAAALRAIPSERRSATARENGKKGGRPRKAK